MRFGSHCFLASLGCCGCGGAGGVMSLGHDGVCAKERRVPGCPNSLRAKAAVACAFRCTCVRARVRACVPRVWTARAAAASCAPRLLAAAPCRHPSRVLRRSRMREGGLRWGCFALWRRGARAPLPGVANQRSERASSDEEGSLAVSKFRGHCASPDAAHSPQGGTGGGEWGPAGA